MNNEVSFYVGYIRISNKIVRIWCIGVRIFVGNVVGGYKLGFSYINILIN